MPVRARLIGAGIALTAALAGCGGDSTPKTTTSATHAATTVVASTSTTQPVSKKRPHKRRKHKVQAQATSATTSGSVRNAPPPTPPGTPPAPSGLAATTGYATYELCSSACGGAVPTALRRSLHLPHLSAGGACPVSAGGGPVRPLGSLRLAVAPFIGSPWKAARVTWISAASYAGPVLVRGRRIGGQGPVGFGEGGTPYDELQLLAPGRDAPPAPGGGRAWLSFTRVRTSGCFAYQVDGTSFSTAIVFAASG
ncbi:MAG: hypothetical protein M3076_09870 [Actinomycetota bacterium]|nr:hypothetical protein [Actinomycetota bacterium]